MSHDQEPTLEPFDRLIKKLSDGSSAVYIIGRPDLTRTGYSAADAVRKQNIALWREHYARREAEHALEKQRRQAARKPFRWPWSALQTRPLEPGDVK